MEKILYKIYSIIFASLCFIIVIVCARFTPFESSHHSIIYDILAICCGFVSAVIFVSYDKHYKGACCAIIIFLIYFLIFKVPLYAIFSAICAFVAQFLIMRFKRIKIQVSIFCIVALTLCIMSIVAHSNDYVKLIFLIEFIFWWHICWSVALFAILEVARFLWHNNWNHITKYFNVESLALDSTRKAILWIKFYVVLLCLLLGLWAILRVISF